MGFIKRFGGWRPVQSEHGVGRLRSADGDLVEEVEYRFEVWLQMVDGFPGPYRSEGRVSAPSSEAFRPFVGTAATLELEDGRRLEVRLDAEGALLAHQRPSGGEAGGEAAGGEPTSGTLPPVASAIE